LEAEANPERRFIEANYDNNIDRAIITLELGQCPANSLPAPRVLPLFLIMAALLVWQTRGQAERGLDKGRQS
jgi:hypothetical protein